MAEVYTHHGFSFFSECASPHGKPRVGGLQGAFLRHGLGSFIGFDTEKGMHQVVELAAKHHIREMALLDPSVEHFFPIRHPYSAVNRKIGGRAGKKLAFAPQGAYVLLEINEGMTDMGGGA